MNRSRLAGFDPLGDRAEVAKDENQSNFAKITQQVDNLINGQLSRSAGVFAGIKAEIAKLGLDTHEGRQEFLSKRLGIAADTPDNFRLVSYRNESGQEMYFKAHLDGDKKLVLTDSLAAPETPGQIHQFFQSTFKPLPQPIEVQIEKSTDTPDGTRLDITPEEQKKLETQSTLAAAIQKSGHVQLASNARLPGKQTATGAGLNT